MTLRKAWATGGSSNTVRSGAGAPTSGVGSAGDFYIDTSAWQIYGPKTGILWGDPTDIVGPEGGDGAAGADGADGADGATGPTGPTGPTGAAGANGADGADGADGREIEVQNSGTYIQWRYVGDAGWTNLVALSAITGPAGTNGTNGTNGAAATVSLGTVATGAAGSSVTITNSGTSSDAVLNFTIPRGDTGATGPSASNTWTLSIGSQALSPADGAIYYFGLTQRVPVTTAQASRIYIRESCTLVAAELVWVTASTIGTSENIVFRIIKNNTTVTSVATVGSTANPKIFSNAALNISLSSGDYIECQIVCPTWATNPTAVVLGGYLKFNGP